MSLVEIKHYLRQVKIASLARLVEHFQCDTEVLRCMMQHWIQKGSVRCFAKTPACGSACVKCSPLVTEIYEWVLL